MTDMGLQTVAWAPHVTCACCGTWWAVLHHLPQSPSKKYRAVIPEDKSHLTSAMGAPLPLVLHPGVNLLTSQKAPPR